MSTRFTAALGAGLLALALAKPAVAQDQQVPPEPAPSDRISEAPQEEIDPEKLRLGRQLTVATRMTREFDEILPNIAEQAKTTLIRSNPQMQLGIIEVVDRVALEMVDRRSELDELFAQVWASAFTTEELQALLDFYRSPVGEKYAARLPRVLQVQIGLAEQWSQSMSEGLFRRVQQELQQMAEAEGQRLQGAPQPPAPQPQLPGTGGQ